MMFFFEEYYNENEGNIYKLEDFLELRGNPFIFEVFYSKYVRQVVGKKKFDRLVKNVEFGEEISTPTDDAFALIVLENNEDMWMDILEKSEGKIEHVKRGEEIPDNLRSDIKPKFTNCDVGIAKQWSVEGIKKFNHYRKLIVDDRKNNNNFIVNYVKNERKKLSLKFAKKDKLQSPTFEIEAENDLMYNANENCIVQTPNKNNNFTNTSNKPDYGCELSDSSRTDSDMDSPHMVTLLRNQGVTRVEKKGVIAV